MYRFPSKWAALAVLVAAGHGASPASAQTTSTRSGTPPPPPANPTTAEQVVRELGTPSSKGTRRRGSAQATDDDPDTWQQPAADARGFSLGAPTKGWQKVQGAERGFSLPARAATTARRPVATASARTASAAVSWTDTSRGAATAYRQTRAVGAGGATYSTVASIGHVEVGRRSETYDPVTGALRGFARTVRRSDGVTLHSTAELLPDGDGAPRQLREHLAQVRNGEVASASDRTRPYDPAIDPPLTDPRRDGGYDPARDAAPHAWCAPAQNACWSLDLKQSNPG